MESTLIPILVAAVGSSVPSVSHVPSPVPSYQPNILLIVLDDVGPDKLAMYRETFAPPHLPAPGAPDLSTPDPTDTLYEDPPYCSSWDEPFPFPKTPVLDKLASGTFTAELAGLQGGGIRFDRAYGAPLCNPARACMLTGRYPFRTGLGVVGNAQSSPYKRLDPDEVLLPELLRKGFGTSGPISPLLKKYRCGAFGKWHLSGLPVFDPNLASDFLHPVSIDWFQYFSGTMENVGTNVVNPGDHYRWTKVTAVAGLPGSYSLTRYDRSVPLVSEFSPSVPFANTVTDDDYTVNSYSASVTAADALSWINAQGQPFFAYVAFNAPHFPFQVPPASRLSPETLNELMDDAHCSGPFCPGRNSKENVGDCGEDDCTTISETVCEPLRIKYFFNAMMEALDTEIGMLIDGIAPSKLAKTMVIVIGDNGTPDPLIEVPYHPANHGKASLFEVGVRVPLIVAGYLAPPDANVCSKDIHAVDLWRTIRDISGASEALADPSNAERDSISFAPFIADPDSPLVLRDSVFCQNFFRAGRFVATDRGPYVHGTDPDDPDCSFPYVFGQQAGHGRSVIKEIEDVRYKLFATKLADGIEVSSCVPDVLPIYDYALFNLDADPHEQHDLFPFSIDQPESIPTEILAIFNILRDEMTEASGY